MTVRVQDGRVFHDEGFQTILSPHPCVVLTYRTIRCFAPGNNDSATVTQLEDTRLVRGDGLRHVDGVREE